LRPDVGAVLARDVEDGLGDAADVVVLPEAEVRHDHDHPAEEGLDAEGRAELGHGLAHHTVNADERLNDLGEDALASVGRTDEEGPRSLRSKGATRGMPKSS
jgi:hypothetical protein